MEFETRLTEANQRLTRDGYKLKIALNNQGNLLILRGTFPPKPNSGKDRSFQQRLFLSLPANPRHFLELLHYKLGDKPKEKDE